MPTLGAPGAITVAGLAKETTFGTGVAPSGLGAWLDFDTITPTYTNKLVERQGVRKTVGQTFSGPGQFQGKVSFDISPTPQVLGYVLAGALGYDTVTASVSSTYTHTITFQNNATSAYNPLNSYTMSLDYGTAFEGTYTQQLVGCKYDTLDISSKAGGLVSLKASMLYTNVVPVATTTLSPNYDPAPAFEFQHIGTLSVGGVQIYVTDFSISLKNNLKPYWASGSGRFVRNINETARQVSGSFTLAYENDTLFGQAFGGYNNVISAGVGNGPQSYLTPGMILAIPLSIPDPSIGTGNSRDFTCQFKCPNIQITDVSMSSKKNDVVMYNCKFNAYESGTGNMDDLFVTVVTGSNTAFNTY